MSKYQITLTPVDKFFFGGDMTFQVGNDEKDEYNSQFKSYIIQSSMYPQQTSLLGMLRFLILRNAGDAVFKDGKIVDKNKAKDLIGSRSFMVDAENDFKAINKISRIRIQRTANGRITELEFAPLFKDLNLDSATKGSYNLQDIDIPSLSKAEYDTKEGLAVKLTDGTESFSLENIFIEDRRVGINRDIKTGIVDDSALFKQISYRLNNEQALHKFIFDAEIEDNVPFESYSGQVVSVGGDNSQFVIGISKAAPTNDSLTPYANAVWLLSPAYLKRAEAKKASFAVTRLLPFRFLQSNMDTVKSYNILSRELNRSERYDLYAPGSVFYFSDEKQKQEFIESLKSKKDFRKIGYNEYK